MTKRERTEALHKERLYQRLVVLSFFNLLVVALLGLLLRSFPFLSSFPFSFQNLLHGHSHFAFGGWIMPVLLALVMKLFSPLRDEVAYVHWRNLSVLLLTAAYGMLLSFPQQGYAPVSIAFSTLSIVATVYFAILVFRASRRLGSTVALRFLKWGLVYACFSALGPFATGPLVALGKAGTPLYFNVIYFYLHFQYNGFFSFTVLALLYRLLEQQGGAGNGRRVFWLLNGACVPTYALSVLWSQPPVVVNVVGAVGACLQLAALVFLFSDIRKTQVMRTYPWLRFSMGALVIKFVLQGLSAVPAVALLAYHQRNFVIAYLHLVLLGFISVFAFSLLVKSRALTRFGVWTFLFSFVTTETLLVLQAVSGFFHFSLPYYSQLLLGCSLFFPVGIAVLLFGFLPERRPVEKSVGCQPASMAS